MPISAHRAEPCHATLAADPIYGLIDRLADDLAPSFACDPDDPADARVMAGHTIAAYNPSSYADVFNIARTISLSLAALAVLRRVASEPMPAALELRYLGLANTLNRSADQSEHSMERRRREPPARRVRAQPAEQPAPPPKLDPQPGRGVMDPAIAAVIHEHLAARRQTDTTQQPHDEPAPSDNPAGKQAEGQPLRYRGAAAAPVSQWQRNLMQTTTMSSVTAPGLPPLSGTPAARQP